MLVRSRAPLRLGIAGGGTDVSPYSDTYGGCVLNATINMYAHCTIEIGEYLKRVSFAATDLNVSISYEINKPMEGGDSLQLHKAVYNRIVNQFCDGQYFPVSVTTWCDAPPGSGLGSSSTVVVAIVEAFKQALNLPLGEYDVAQLAYDIERIDCNLAGGKQDQYAATFGGFNFIEFYDKNRVIVNPLRIRHYIMNELEESLILFYTGASRDSANIISDQINAIDDKSGSPLEAMHEVKKAAFKMKEFLLRGDINSLLIEFKDSWNAKKRTSKSISNSMIDAIEDLVINAGAKSIKVSGAGGGGFMMIFVDPVKKSDVERALQDQYGQVYRVQFTSEGCSSWTI